MSVSIHLLVTQKIRGEADQGICGFAGSWLSRQAAQGVRFATHKPNLHCCFFCCTVLGLTLFASTTEKAVGVEVVKGEAKSSRPELLLSTVTPSKGWWDRGSWPRRPNKWGLGRGGTVGVSAPLPHTVTRTTH